MADLLKRAKETRRAAMLAAAGLPDEQAATVPTLFPEWKAGEAVAEGERCYYPPTDRLYKCRQAHTTQADWTPDKTPALWAAVDAAHAGTADDPIPAAAGMDYIVGKFYLDPVDGKTYRCTREGMADGETVNLQFLPHELVGQYFELI